MKKLITGIFVVTVALCFFAAAHSAVVYKLWLPDTLTGGTATSLDGIHSGNSDLPDNALAIVSVTEDDTSGVTHVFFFKYDSGATAAEDTSGAHPWTIVPDDLPDSGIWNELSVVSAFGTN